MEEKTESSGRPPVNKKALDVEQLLNGQIVADFIKLSCMENRQARQQTAAVRQDNQLIVVAPSVAHKILV